MGVENCSVVQWREHWAQAADRATTVTKTTQDAHWQHGYINKWNSSFYASEVEYFISEVANFRLLQGFEQS